MIEHFTKVNSWSGVLRNILLLTPGTKILRLREWLPAPNTSVIWSSVIKLGLGVLLQRLYC